MTEFMRDDVRLRKGPGRGGVLRQLIEERQIQVDLPIAGAIERPGGRLREAAGRVDRIAKQNDTRSRVARTEDLRPGILRVFRDGVDEVDLTLLSWRRLQFARGAERQRRCSVAGSQK